MSAQARHKDTIISERDIDSDFEYNFDLNPYTYLLEGIHLLIQVPTGIGAGLIKRASGQLHKIKEEQSFRRTFKGPACMLK